MPEPHTAGTRLFFWDTFNFLDDTEYASGESIDVKVAPVTGLGSLDLADIDAESLTFDQRAYRPYPPGNLLIEAESYGAGPYEEELSIAWAHRDRTQQTGGIIYDHTFGNIGPEAGVVYKVLGYIDGVLVHTEDDIIGTSTTWTPTDDGLVRIEVWSKRDGLLSMQAAHHEFYYTTTDFLGTEDDDFLVSEEGHFMVTEA